MSIQSEAARHSGAMRSGHFGLAPSEPDRYVGTIEIPEKWVLWLFSSWLGLALIGTLVHVFSSNLTVASIFEIPESADFLRYGGIALGTILIYLPLGMAVERLGINVAFTRKAGHILAVFILPLILVPEPVATTDLYRDWYQTMVWQSIGIVVIPYCLFIRPIRSRIRIFYYCMRAIDRPEDRPYTLLWFCSQILATSVILVPMTQYYVHLDLWSLYLIPAMACGLGDGLAEPVGKILSTKKYRVRALFSDREYVRTYAGSACVFIFTAIGVLFSNGQVAPSQFLFLLLTVPAGMALTEALAPHTWDNWFMYVVCGLLIHIALSYVPVA